MRDTFLPAESFTNRWLFLSWHLHDEERVPLIPLVLPVGLRISPAVYPELQQSVNIAFAVFFILGLVGIAASYALGTVRESH